MHGKVKKISLAIFGVLIIGALWFFLSGYRISSSLAIVKRGTLVIDIPLADTHVYINGRDRFISTRTQQQAVFQLMPGSHEIVIGKEGYFPWKRDVVIQEKETQTIYPIWRSRNTTGEIITERDPEYNSIYARIQNNALPTKTKPLVSTDGNVSIWVEGQSIMSETADGSKTVFTGISPIRSVAFYKNRPDVIMFAHETGIYIIDRDAGGFQNFMPVYIGQEPRFEVANEESIYVKDRNMLLRVIL